MKVLLIDNFDSFTFNLLHYLQIAGAEVAVVRNNALTADQMNLQNFDAAVLSPGPCTPTEAGGLMDFLQLQTGRKPLLGVCLGMQAIAMHFGWILEKARLPRHGKTSLVVHSEKGIFKNISSPMQTGRYHSLVVHPPKNGTELAIEAECDGEIMAISGKDNLLWGVQFHPESILTPSGQQLINQWVSLIQH
jgi:anthranilate synthase/aminodeoxychorismate synthase-like glutamine amidotransferase